MNNTFMGHQDQKDETNTLVSQDYEYYNYLNCKKMFENAEYHGLKPTMSNYQISA